MRAARAKLSLATILVSASLFGLAACDQTDLRAERAQEVARAALEQIQNGEPDLPTRPMADVDQIDRALSGEIIPASVFESRSVRPNARASRFAIGSIIAKPIDIVQEEAALTVPYGESVPLEAPPVLELDPDAPEALESVAEKTRPLMESLEKQERIPLEASPAFKAGPFASPRTTTPEISENTEEEAELPGISAEDRRLVRRAIPTPRVIQHQADARSHMLDTMSKFGLAGNVELSTSGQMVIQLGADGADPTQGSDSTDGETNALPALAIEDGTACPDNPDPQLVRENPIMATDCVVKELRESGAFAYVEKDFIFDHQFARRPTTTPVTASAVPNDPLFDLQWHFKRNGIGEDRSVGGSGFADFWDRQDNQGSREVTVAVVDTGLEMGHPDIKDSPNIAPGWDMVSDPRTGNDGDGRDSDPNDPGDLCDPSDPTQENSFHGTHVAGTIGAAASNNRAGVAGGAWSVKIVPVRALGRCGGRLSDINDAIRWAGGLVPAFDDQGNEIWNENPADIINLSIGLFEYCPASLQDAITSVTQRGVIVVSAAGNDRVSTEFYAPGGCADVISVAASDGRGQITPYSNFGDEVDLIAPGGDLSRDDNGDGHPDGVLSTKHATNCVDPLNNEAVADCFYAYEQGTSMAAPHVSAALALIMAKYPELDVDQVTETLLNATDPRASNQCAGSCERYPGTDPIEGSEGLCMRPCGVGLLNLERLP